VRTIAVTGSGSGMGAALTERLTAAGDRVIGVDVKNAEVQADLATPGGRAEAIARVEERSGGALDGLVTCAGLNGLPDRPASLLVAVNYFATVEMLTGLRPLLAEGTEPAAVAISSNSTTCAPGIDESLVAACLAGDEEVAKARAGEGESVSTYPVTKTALAWWVRRHAVEPEWAGAGITLNAVAPGAVDTPLLQEGLDDPTIGPLIAAFQAPIGRNGRPEEIAALLEYLLGPDARFFCGSVLFCDGGMDARLRSDDWPSPWKP
jgi:NAD(P)-dependent dehydrogenase (short-subunit alcohol dehydrogenase family)